MESCYQALNRGAEDFFIGAARASAESAGHPLPLAYVTVLICAQGHAEWEVNFQACRMEQGDFLVLAEDAIARVTSRSEDWSCACYLLKRSIAAEVASALPNSLFAYLSRHPFFRSEPDGAPFLAAWQTQAALIHEHCSAYRRTMLIHHFQNLFLWLCETRQARDASPPSDFSRPEAICWQFWELIAAHCRQEREVAFYAGRLHITPYYLAQLTRRYFNDAPKTLIDRQVVLEIKKELAYSKRPIQRIAEALNFTDASYLGKYFKRHTGTGLSEYRRRQGGPGRAKRRAEET